MTNTLPPPDLETMDKLLEAYRAIERAQQAADALLRATLQNHQDMVARLEKLCEAWEEAEKYEGDVTRGRCAESVRAAVGNYQGVRHGKSEG